MTLKIICLSLILLISVYLHMFVYACVCKRSTYNSLYMHVAPREEPGCYCLCQLYIFILIFIFFIISLRQYLSLTWNSTNRLGYMDNGSHNFSRLCFSYGGIYRKISPLPVSLYGQKKIINKFIF